MKRQIKGHASLFIILGFWGLTWPVVTAPPLQAQAKTPYQKLVTIEGITEYRLENGLRFLLFPDPSSNTVTVNMTVLVGSRHEGYGETGMAHLLEHMTYKGSKNFPTHVEVDKARQAHGCQGNATTWVDRTNFYETMAASDKNLEFGIMFEAELLSNCIIRREDLVKEMTVVRNEFEQGENSPDYILSQRMLATAFEWHNYGKSTIGNRSDIEKVPIENLQAFYRKYYRPDNAILVVAGKFDEQKAIAHVLKYFAPMAKPPAPLPKTYTEEPAQDGERTVILRRVGKVPMVGVVYHVPAGPHEDFAPVDILSSILGDTPSGRLYKELVQKKKATRIAAYSYAWHDPGVLEITARISDESTPEEVRSIIVEEVEKLAAKPVTKEEVDRAVKRYLAERERALTRSKDIALELSEWIACGDWRLLFIHRDRVAKVTPDDVMRVAGKYLKESNRTVGLFYPSEKVARAVIPETPSVAELVKDYKGGKTLSQGETFDPTPANIESRVKRFELSTGLKVAFLSKKTRGETVVGELVLRFGNEKSLQEDTTACSFIGPLLMRGTKKHSRQEIQDILDKLGSDLGASSTTGRLSFFWESKRDKLPAMLDLLKEVLREPTFPQAEFDILKRSTKQQIEKSMTDPQGLAFRSLVRQLHPYSESDIRYRPTFQESLQRLEKTDRDQVARVYQDQVGAQAGELVIVGDFDEQAVKDQLEGIFAGWKSKVSYERIAETANTKVPGKKENILTPDKEGAIFVAGLALPLSKKSPDYPALLLGNYILGGSETSRMYYGLRQMGGISYGTGSRLSLDAQDPYGLFFLFALCNPQSMDKADQISLEEFSKLLKKGVTEEELKASVKAFLSDLQVERGKDDNLASLLREGLYLGQTMHDRADLEKKIAALKVEEVNRAVATHLSINRLVIVRAGDFTKAKQDGKGK